MPKIAVEIDGRIVEKGQQALVRGELVKVVGPVGKHDPSLVDVTVERADGSRDHARFYAVELVCNDFPRCECCDP